MQRFHLTEQCCNCYNKSLLMCANFTLHPQRKSFAFRACTEGLLEWKGKDAACPICQRKASSISVHADYLAVVPPTDVLHLFKILVTVIIESCC